MFVARGGGGGGGGQKQSVPKEGIRDDRRLFTGHISPHILTRMIDYFLVLLDQISRLFVKLEWHLELHYILQTHHLTYNKYLKMLFAKLISIWKMLTLMNTIKVFISCLSY